MQNYVQSVIATDMCAENLALLEAPEGLTCEKIVMDEENLLFESNKFDMVASCLK